MSSLSSRTIRALDDLFLDSPRAKEVKQYDPDETIDLHNAQNEVLRPELVEFFKTTVEEKLTEKVFEMPPKHGGDQALLEALATFFNTYFNPIHTVTSKDIVVTAGASEAIETAVYAICDDGDSVIIPGPFWYSLGTLLKTRANVNVITAHPPTYQNYDNYLLPSLQAAYDFSADKSRIKAVLICNPNNPLSRCYPKKVLVECMEFCQERGLHLISDEIHALSTLNLGSSNNPPFTSALALTEPFVPEGAVKIDRSRVHVVWSPSKLFGSSGFRIGCLISQQNPQIIAATILYTAFHTNNIASLYLTSLLTWPQLPTLLALNSERLTKSYNLLATALRQWNIEFITPTDGILLFAKLAKHAQTDEDESEYFDKLSRYGVRVGPGRLFKGVEREFGWARIRFSVPLDVMESAVQKLSTFLAVRD